MKSNHEALHDDGWFNEEEVIALKQQRDAYALDIEELQEQLRQLNAAYHTEIQAKILSDYCYEKQYQRAQAAKAKLAAVEKDAERYRWLWNQVQHDSFIPIAQCVWKRNNNPHSEWVNLAGGNELDAAIDAAMKETGK